MRRKKNENEEVQEIKQKRRKPNKDSVDISKGIEIANKAVEKYKKIKKESAKKQEREKKDNKVLKYIIVVIIAIVVILLFKYRHIIGITFSKEITEENAIVIETTASDTKIYPYQNEILIYSKGTITTYSRYGKKTWEYTFDETFIPEINTNGKYIQVINKDSGYIYIFDNKYESCRKKIDGSIKLASINQKGQSTIYYSKEGIKSDIGIYDKKGKQEYEVTLKTENIADAILSNNGRYLYMYEVETRRN